MCKDFGKFHNEIHEEGYLREAVEPLDKLLKKLEPSEDLCFKEKAQTFMEIRTILELIVKLAERLDESAKLEHIKSKLKELDEAMRIKAN